jgi:AcrR family transcriptional regulator
MPRKKNSMKKVVDATMALAAEAGWNNITLADIADKAAVPLADLRLLVDDKQEILKQFMAEIDGAVLAAMEADAGDEHPRDRLFDLLMQRFELLEPHKSALQKISRDLRGNPLARLSLVGTLLQSMDWMLNGAGISTSGARGSVKSKGLAAIYLSVMGTWFEDDDPGLARTMAMLDRKLRRGEGLLRSADIPLGLGGALLQFGAALCKRRAGRRDAEAPDPADPAPTT